MKTVFIKAVFVAMALLLIAPETLFAEYVFLRDGSIVKCKIESETAEAVVMRLADGNVKTVSPKQIMRILFTDVYMGKIFVNKTDGTVLEVYMVDEDQTTFTFRKDLYKPEEFKVRRDEVLFTARKNPTGLEGKSATDSIDLTWKPPYNKTKYYKVYFKSGSEYKLHGQTGSTSYTIKDLKGNTTYYVKVTAVDVDDYESLPSNEIKVVTSNIAPDVPERVKCKRSVDAKGKKMKASLSWREVNDPDGKIKTYRVYVKNEKGFALVGNTAKNRYDVTGLEPDKNYYYTVRSVDDKDSESENSRLVNTLDLKGYDLIVSPVCIYPFGRFADVNKMGFGVNCTGLATDVIFDNFDAGVMLGGWYFLGATDDVELSILVPMLGTINYWFEPFERFRLTPRLGLGYSFNYVSYKGTPSTYTGYGPEKTSKSDWAFEPMATAGLAASYNCAEYWTVGAGVDYGVIYEKDNLIMFVSAIVDVTKKF